MTGFVDSLRLRRRERRSLYVCAHGVAVRGNEGLTVYLVLPWAAEAMYRSTLSLFTSELPVSTNTG